MGLFGSIYVGYSGVNSQTRGMRVAADNIANLNTTGFKGSRALFEDLLAEVTGEVWPRRKGLGSLVKDIDINFSSGAITATDIPTDLAIMGKGFFVVQDAQGNTFFTRDGQFLLEETGTGTLRMVSPAGYRLLGAAPDATPSALTALSPLEIPRSIPGRGTEIVHLEMNLDARKETEETPRSLLEAWDAANDPPISTQDYEFVTTLTIYDTTGVSHNLNLYFDTTDQNNQYEMLLTLADPTEDRRGTGRYAGALLWGTLNFGARGDISSAEFYSVDPSGALTPLDLNTLGRPQFTVNFTGEPQTITLDLGFYYQDGSLVRTPQSIHLYGAPFAVYYQDQDGYPPGLFDRVEIDHEGMVRAFYTNQQKLEVGRIFLADFTGVEDVLERAGANLFRAKDTTLAQLVAPGRTSAATLNSGALEESNVDLATEMVNLITLQRAFQSNARVITTADQMLEDFLRIR